MDHSTTFKDRTEAGKRLAVLLSELKDTNSTILAIPRGGVIVGKEVADSLKLPLDLIVTRKIGAPGNEEYAIGAIDIDGDGVFNEREVATVDKEWVKQKIAEEQEEAARRWSLYRGTRGPLDLKGKTAIIVDDGIATGLTTKAAIRYAKKLGAQKVVVASPVASPEVAHELEGIAEVRILTLPPLFFAVGQFYQDFPQVSDEEVITMMKAVAQ